MNSSSDFSPLANWDDLSDSSQSEHDSSELSQCVQGINESSLFINAIDTECLSDVADSGHGDDDDESDDDYNADETYGSSESEDVPLARIKMKKSKQKASCVGSSSLQPGVEIPFQSGASPSQDGVCPSLSDDNPFFPSVPPLNTPSQLGDSPSQLWVDVPLQSEIGPSQSGNSPSSQSVPPLNTPSQLGDGPSQPWVDVPLQSEIGPSQSGNSLSSQSVPPQNIPSQSEMALLSLGLMCLCSPRLAHPGLGIAPLLNLHLLKMHHLSQKMRIPKLV